VLPRALGKDRSSVFVSGIEAGKRVGEVIETSEPLSRDLVARSKVARRAPIIPRHHLFHVERRRSRSRLAATNQIPVKPKTETPKRVELPSPRLSFCHAPAAVRKRSRGTSIESNAIA
jgi:hypothetical protein